MADISGTPRSVSLDGVSFRIAADANLTDNFTVWVNEMQATSGSGMLKKTKRIPTVENVPLVVNGAEREQIRVFNDQTDLITMNYKDASGNVFRTEGTISVEGLETETNRCTITMQASEEWVAFLAS